MIKCKTIQWDKVLEKVNSQQWAESLVSGMKESFENHMRLWPKEPPLHQSEWGHYYFCSDCGVGLIFDITKPHTHVCPKCSKIYSGWPYDGTWCKLLHNNIVSNMERAAILAHIPQADDKYKNYIHDTMLYYANNYEKYPEHGKHAGIGKVYPQALSEAIFVIAMERILRMSCDLNIFSEEEYNTIAKLFFTPALNLIKPQIKKIHNIHMWMQGAVAACANVLGDMDLLKDAIYSEFGWLNQLEKGVTKEGIWYEISATYHYYTLSPLMSLAWIAFENDINLFQNQTLSKMASNYIALAYPNGQFPAYNDGWFGTNIFERCTVYEELSSFNPSFGTLLSWMYENMSIKQNSVLNNGAKQVKYPRASVSALLYGPVNLPEAKAPVRESFVYEDTGIAVLQNDNIRVSFKFTGNGGGHDHNDKNAIEVYANNEFLIYDVGTTGYALPLTREWSRTSAAHNMVCVNYQRQRNSSARLLHFDSKSVCAEAKEAYENVSLKRSISLKEDGFDDTYTVSCGEASQIDWIFHCKGKAETNLQLKSREPFIEENGYNQLFDLQEADCDTEFCVSFISEKQRVDMHFEGEEGTKVIIGKCYGTNQVDILSFVMLRRSSKETQFLQQTRISNLNQK